MASDTRYTDEWWATAHGRRALLRGALLGGVGLAAAALIGCGGDDDDDDDAVAPAAPAETATQVAAATEAPAADEPEGLVTPRRQRDPVAVPGARGRHAEAGRRY